MEDDLWFAYLEQVAQREKALAAEAAHQEKASVADAALAAKPEKPKPAAPSPFACEELPPE
jgi:hypothetical protein